MKVARNRGAGWRNSIALGRPRAFWCRFGAAWAGPRDRSREATNAEGETLRHEPEGGAEMQAVAHPPYHPCIGCISRQNQKLLLYVFTAPDPTVPRAVLGLGREAGCGCGFCNAVWHRRRFFI